MSLPAALHVTDWMGGTAAGTPARASSVPSGASCLRDWIVSLSLCCAITGAFLAVDQRCFHWFAIPVLACGIIIGADVVSWVRGRVDLLDPAGIIGLLGFHFFFLAPFLHVVWDWWMAYVTPPREWRDWLGGMALLNLLGLLAYRCFRTVNLTRGGVAKQPAATWRFKRTRLAGILLAVLLASALLQIRVYSDFGGISGYINAYMEGERHYGSPYSAFVGKGWIFTFSEAFPIVAWLGFLAFFRDSKLMRSWPLILASMLPFFGLLILFGGLRGSRTNTVCGLFWAVAAVHLFVRPLSRRLLAAGMAFLLSFMYLYGFYKAAGTYGMDALKTADGLHDLAEKSGRTWKALLLGDLGRADLQAFILYRVLAPGSDYRYAWGGTYVGATALLIPRAIWPGRPATKIRWLTDLEMGSGAYASGQWLSSRVAGLAGEGMLNFGPVAVVPLYALFGLAVGAFSRFARSLDPLDSRRLALPVFLLSIVLALVNDSEILVFGLIKNGVVPMAMVFWSSVTLRKT